ncbi:MAG: ABC transporter permease [Desulfohalobiaceae bacterium]|nr:ABC transporter permease [Desulfohalobiaceae bacterium]MCF8106813.1 ABC transporter permease [Desulfohalobiaceae bacterium]
MKSFILKRAGASLITVFAVICLNFLIFRLAPGDPVKMMFTDPRVTAEQMQEVREKFGLDKPLGGQFISYVQRLAHGDLGISFWQKKPVTRVLAEKIPQTLILVITALGMAVILGVILGALAGWKTGTRLDTFIVSASLAMYSIPSFALGLILLLVFAYTLTIFPLSGMSTPASGLTGFGYLKDVAWHMVLPAFSIVMWYIGEFVVLTRSSMTDVLGQEYITSARAKGVKESGILWRHALRNALLPVVTMTGVNLGFAVAGVIEAETVFSWPGIGLLTYEAVMKRDYPLLQGIFLLFAVSVILANFVVDIIYGYIDPRIRVGE